MIQMTMCEPDEIDEARREGRMEAELFDLRLRVIDACERENRFVRLSEEGSDLPAVGTPFAVGDVALVERLRRDVEQLSAFQRAVVRSRGWRLLQILRGVVGRAW